MSAVVIPPLIQFFIPAIAAIGLDVPQLALGCSSGGATPGDRVPRLSYRFTYRISRDGLVYGCRIKASIGVAYRLIEALQALADTAAAGGDSAMLVGCAMALEAIEKAIRGQRINDREVDVSPPRTACRPNFTRIGSRAEFRASSHSQPSQRYD